MTFPVRITWKIKTFRIKVPRFSFETCFLGHDWSGWYEVLNRSATGRRHRQCKRCLKIETGE